MVTEAPLLLPLVTVLDFETSVVDDCWKLLKPFWLCCSCCCCSVKEYPKDDERQSFISALDILLPSLHWLTWTGVWQVEYELSGRSYVKIRWKDRRMELDLPLQLTEGVLKRVKG